MEEQTSDEFASRWIEGMRDGKSPQEFIALQVASMRSAVEKQPGDAQFGNGDIAYIAQFWISQGVVSIEDLQDIIF